MVYSFMAKSDHQRALLTVSLATGLSLLGDSAMYTVLPSHYSSLGITLATVGVLLSINRFIRVFLNGPVGILTDRWPRRWVFVPAVFLGGISTAIYAVSGSFWPLMGGRLIWGLAWAGIWVSGNAIVLDISTDENRGMFVGRYQTAFFLGAASGSILGGILTDVFDYHWAMATASAFSLFGAMAALVFLPETSQWRSPASELSRLTSQEDKPPDVPQLISATALLGVNRLVVAGIMIATFGRYLADMLGSVVTIGQMAVGVATITGLALGLSTLIGMVVAPAAGRLSDSYKSRWGVASGGLTSGLTGFSLLAIGSPIAIILGLPLVSASSGSNQALSTALIGDLSPRIRHGRRLGILFTVGDLASAIGPPLAYALLPIIGLSAIYGASAGLIGVMLLIALWWTRKARMTLARAG
jgi:MFS family permease